MNRVRWLVVAALGLVAAADRAGAQAQRPPVADRRPEPGQVEDRPRPDSLLVGDVARDRERLREITGGRRDTASSSGIATGPELLVAPVLPALLVRHNSDIAASGNDGALWSGRGLNLAVSGGVQGRLDVNGVRVELSLVPTVTYSANRPFPVFPAAEPTRSGFSSPWHAGDASADLPLRFGANPLRTVSPGESAIRVSARNVVVGAGWMSRWWGPGIRNALLLSNNAASVPQVHVGTRHPLRTPIGEFGALLMVGTLTESPYFDVVPTNDYRSLSGLRVEFRPAAPANLTIGFSHLVMRPLHSASSVGALHEAITRWDVSGDGEAPRVDQLLALDARWVFPESGFEVYGEAARLEPPASLYDWAVAAHRTQGYTLGAQWATRVPRADDRLRLQAEVTYLEQSRVEGSANPPSYYVGRATQHGFTQRGQLLGATVGPGGSSQWLAADYVAPRWQAGLFVGRNRWENDAMYSQPVPHFYKHDVTIQSGVRAAWRHRLGDVAGDLAVGRRMNYLFQSSFGVPGGFRNVDIQNVTLSLTVTPRYPAASLVRRLRAATSMDAPTRSTDTAP